LKEIGLVRVLGQQTKESLEKFLCLDPQYHNLLLLKKIIKGVDELLTNEDLINKVLEWRDR